MDIHLHFSFSDFVVDDYCCCYATNCESSNVVTPGCSCGCFADSIARNGRIYSGRSFTCASCDSRVWHHFSACRCSAPCVPESDKQRCKCAWQDGKDPSNIGGKRHHHYETSIPKPEPAALLHCDATSQVSECGWQAAVNTPVTLPQSKGRRSIQHGATPTAKKENTNTTAVATETLESPKPITFVSSHKPLLLERSAVVAATESENMRRKTATAATESVEAEVAVGRLPPAETIDGPEVVQATSPVTIAVLDCATSCCSSKEAADGRYGDCGQCFRMRRGYPAASEPPVSGRSSD